jgi:hypothetical protein
MKSKFIIIFYSVISVLTLLLCIFDIILGFHFKKFFPYIFIGILCCILIIFSNLVLFSKTHK